MPGPDFPWALYVAGATHFPRPDRVRISSVLLHACAPQTPESLADLHLTARRSFHYIVTATGSVIQLAPERNEVHAIGEATRPKWSNHRAIQIALEGAPDQPTWPEVQVLAVSQILSVTFSVRGILPVRDAAHVTKKRHPGGSLASWPWLDMHRRVLRLSTPIDRLYEMAACGADPPSVTPA